MPLDNEQTRRRLAEGSLFESLRAKPPEGVVLRTEAELAESLEDTLRHHDPAEDLHVFGYGSLMWNPAMDVADAGVACLQGWHRRFCLRLLFGRGTVEEPGAMLALDRGGACNGMLFRIEAHKVRAEMRLLWRREMMAGSYDARWVTARIERRSVRALTFVVNRHSTRYIARGARDDVAHMIRTGKGVLGTSRDYFESTLRALESLRIRDRGMQRLQQAVRQADGQGA
jgi:glutathione-specific gamma-glutamylcyclotransferase